MVKSKPDLAGSKENLPGQSQNQSLVAAIDLPGFEKSNL